MDTGDEYKNLGEYNTLRDAIKGANKYMADLDNVVEYGLSINIS